jgi:hypothetical protein
MNANAASRLAVYGNSKNILWFCFEANSINCNVFVVCKFNQTF